MVSAPIQSSRKLLVVRLAAHLEVFWMGCLIKLRLPSLQRRENSRGWLEQQLQGQLQLPSSVLAGSDGAHLRGAQSGGRIPEDRMIENIERLNPEFRFEMFSDGVKTEQRSVEVVV